MDPNANLAELRRLVLRLVEPEEYSRHGQLSVESSSDAVRMAELVKALDGWLSSGGFIPDAWRTR